PFLTKAGPWRSDPALTADDLRLLALGVRDLVLGFALVRPGGLGPGAVLGVGVADASLVAVPLALLGGVGVAGLVRLAAVPLRAQELAPLGVHRLRHRCVTGGHGGLAGRGFDRQRPARAPAY